MTVCRYCHAPWAFHLKGTRSAQTGRAGAAILELMDMPADGVLRPGVPRAVPQWHATLATEQGVME